MLGDIMSGIGNVASAPGDWLRGAMLGKFGSRFGGRDFLKELGLVDDGSGFGADLAGTGLEMILDPLAIAAPILGAAKATGAYTGGLRKLAQMAEAGEELPMIAGLGKKFDMAADLQRGANMGTYTDDVARVQDMLKTTAEPIPDPYVWQKMVPSPVEMGELNRMSQMGGTARGSNLVGSGMKSYGPGKFSPDAYENVAMTGMGEMTPGGGMEVIPKPVVTYRDAPPDLGQLTPPPGMGMGYDNMFNAIDAGTFYHPSRRGAKAVAPPILQTRGGKAFAHPEFNMDNIDLNAVGGTFPTMPYESMLRQAGATSTAREQALLQLINEDPTVMMELIARGTDSPLARAILGGVGAGGAYAVGNAMFGD